MDPQARHSVWTLLQKFKKEKKCSILLTTHFMDEADCLGDRIAIMSRGELKCCGSPMYLKSMYGSGYNLILTRRSNGESEPSFSGNNLSENTNQIFSLINRHIPNAKLSSEIASELNFILPKDDSVKFPELLFDLETNKESLHIVNIGISITTIEDVFLKIGELENLDENEIREQEKIVNSNSIISNDKDNINLIDENDKSGLWIGSSPADRVSYTELLRQQFTALFRKRMIHTFRNKILSLTVMIVPLAILIIVLLYAKYGPLKAENSLPLEIKLDRYRENFAPFQIQNNSNSSVLINLSQAFENQIKSSGNSKPFNLDDNKVFSVCSDKRSTMEDFLVCIGKYSLNYINDNFIVGVNFEKDINDENSINILGHFNNQPLHVPPLAVNTISNMLIKYLTNNSRSTINVINHPLPRDIKAKASDLKLKDSTGFNVASDLTSGFSYLIGSFVFFLIKERVSGAKHIQYLSGANSLVFWLSALIWDFFNFLITTVLTLLVMWAFDLTEFIGGIRLWYVFGLFALYGLAHIPQSYLMSYMFVVPATGFAVTVAWNILISQATITTVGILSLPMLGLESVSAQLEWIFLIIFPNFSFGQALADLYSNYQANQFCPQFVEFCEYDPCCTLNPCCIKFSSKCSNYTGNCIPWTPNYLDWEKPGLLRFLVFMNIQFATQFLIVLLYETGILRKLFYKIQHCFSKKSIDLDTNYARLEMERLYGDIEKDQEVIDEEMRIEELNVQTSDDLLVIDSLTKYYKSFMAVKGISLGIKSGETFGLLGVNGAGK